MFKKGFQLGRTIVGAFIAVALAYIIYQVVVAFQNDVKTLRAQVETYYDSLSGKGVLLRDETVLQPAGGSYILLVSNGDKVSIGDRYAVVYSSESGMKSYEERAELSERISRLNDIKTGGDSYTDLAALNSRVYDLLANGTAASEMKGEYGVSSERSELERLLLVRKYTIEGSEGIDGEIVALKQKKDALPEGGTTGYLTVPTPGYYSVTVDGYESALSLSSSDSITADDIEGVANTPAKEGVRSGTGKLITSYKWRLATALPTDEAKKLTVGKKYTLGLDDKMIPAKLLSVREDAGGESVLIFESNYSMSQVASLRSVDVRVILKEYTGYRIPRDALRVIDGVPGVFCLEGVQARFKKVEVLYSAENYYIAAADFTETQGLFINDTIIINTKDLYDGKIVE